MNSYILYKYSISYMPYYIIEPIRNCYAMYTKIKIHFILFNKYSKYMLSILIIISYNIIIIIIISYNIC